MEIAGLVRVLVLWPLLTLAFYFAGPTPYRGVALSQTAAEKAMPAAIWTADIYRNGDHRGSMDLPPGPFSLAIPGAWRCTVAPAKPHNGQQGIGVARWTFCRGPAGDRITLSTICAPGTTPSAATGVLLHDAAPLDHAYTKLLIICVLNGN